MSQLGVAPLRLASAAAPMIVLPQDVRAGTPTSISSASSSLLAKRLGADRAAALALDGSDARQAKGKWTRQGGRNLTPPASGLLGSPGLMSPAWQPRLTPTRRGDDLVLSVQRQ